jgi:hypothetical protein
VAAAAAVAAVDGNERAREDVMLRAEPIGILSLGAVGALRCQAVR